MCECFRTSLCCFLSFPRYPSSRNLLPSHPMTSHPGWQGGTTCRALCRLSRCWAKSNISIDKSAMVRWGSTCKIRQSFFNNYFQNLKKELIFMLCSLSKERQNTILTRSALSKNEPLRALEAANMSNELKVMRSKIKESRRRSIFFSFLIKSFYPT